MPVYKYKARDKSGKAIDGVMEASSSQIVAGHLDSLSYIPVSIKEKKKDIIPLDFLRANRGVGLDNLILFSRQLSTLINAGIPLLRGLDALSEQTENKRMKEVIDTIRNDIQGGGTLSDALSRHPKVFSELYAGMIHAGETAGTLDEILDRLASLNEREKDTRARIKEATRYPKIVVITISAAFIVLVNFVVPRFAKMFSNFDATLPLPTRIMIGISHVFREYWFVMIIAASLIALGFRWYTNTKSGRLKWDGLMLRIPVFGPLFLKITLSRFTHILGMLIRSGINILDALKIVSATTGNVVISRELDKLEESVRQGGGLSQQLRKSGVFTPMVVQMISVGEETGKIDEMLAKVSQYYELETEYTIKNLSTLIEPVLIITIGGMVLFLALGIFLPMWDMARVVLK